MEGFVGGHLAGCECFFLSFFLSFFAFGIVFLVGVVLWWFVGWVGRQVGVISGVLLWGDGEMWDLCAVWEGGFLFPWNVQGAKCFFRGDLS